MPLISVWRGQEVEHSFALALSLRVRWCNHEVRMHVLIGVPDESPRIHNDDHIIIVPRSAAKTDMLVLRMSV